MRWTFACLVVVMAPLARAQPGPNFGDAVAQATQSTRASVSPNGPWHTQDPDRWFDNELAIREDIDAHPSFIETVPGARLVLYTERSTLADVSVNGAVIYPNVASAHGPLSDRSPGMKLAPGTQIQGAVPAAKGLLKVTLPLGDLVSASGVLLSTVQITGYLAASAVDKVYRKTDLSWNFVPDVTLPGGFQLLDAPAGAAFVVSTDTERVEAMRLQRNGKFTLVRIFEGPVGWIASSQVQPIRKSGKGAPTRDIVQPVLIERQERTAEGRTETLPSGTPLLDAPDGRITGRVEQDFYYRPVKQDDRWLRFDIPTRFGAIEVWARSPATPSAVETKQPIGAVPRNIPPAELEANRTSGEREIAPDDATRTEIAQAGKGKLVGAFKFCLDVAGAVSTVTQLKSTSFSAYDTKIQERMRTWRYRPYLIDGHPAPVCSVVTITYQREQSARP